MIKQFFAVLLISAFKLAEWLPEKYFEVYEKRDRRRWENRAGSLDKHLPANVPIDEVVKHAKYGRG